MGKLRRVVFFQNNAQIFGNGLVAAQMLGHVEFRQIGNVDFLGGSCPLLQMVLARATSPISGLSGALGHTALKAKQPAIYQAAPACNCKPRALVTLRTVAKLGLPFSLSAL